MISILLITISIITLIIFFALHEKGLCNPILNNLIIMLSILVLVCSSLSSLLYIKTPKEILIEDYNFSKTDRYVLIELKNGEIFIENEAFIYNNISAPNFNLVLIKGYNAWGVEIESELILKRNAATKAVRK